MSEPEVDPYFEEHIGKGFAETKEAIIKYLELYIDPHIVSVTFVAKSKNDRVRGSSRQDGYDHIRA